MKKFIIGILTFIGLGFGINFSQNISPDSAEISVKDPIIMGEATNLKIDILKNDSKMTSYNGTIRITVTEQNGTPLKDNEYTIPSRGRYTFLGSDLGSKEFQKGLEIKKEGTFYIEVQDLNDEEDKILGKQLIHVIRRDNERDIKYIDVLNPNPNYNLIGNKIDIIAIIPEIPNSEAIIYIDEKQVGKTNVGSDGSINITIGDINEGIHNLLIQIFDTDGNIMGKSDTIQFNASPNGEGGIKSIIIKPNELLMVGDTPEITIYTDDIIESVKMRLSDRSDNDAMVISKVGIGEFSQKFFLLTGGEINLSFDTYAANNSVHKSYDNYTGIKVVNEPIISGIIISTDASKKTANITREVINGSIISGYLINWWVDGSSLSGNERTKQKNFNFPNSLPYDTNINVNITPYRDKESNKHGSASKTIKFIISKENVCGNSICENGEDYTSCPQDCPGATITLEPSCPTQNISIHTTKIGNNYYLVRDKAENVTKYTIYASSSPDGKDKNKVYETTDTSYEYPFDHKSNEDLYMYFRIIGTCENGDEIELSGATKIQVGPSISFFLLMCLTFLVYAGIKLFRQTEE